MRQKVSSYEEKKRFILYKGHTGWKIKTRIFGSLLITFSAFAFAGNSNIISVHAATDTTQQEENSPLESKNITAASDTNKETSNSNTVLNDGNNTQPVVPQATGGIQKAAPEIATDPEKSDTEISNESSTNEKQEPVAGSTESSAIDTSKSGTESEQTMQTTTDSIPKVSASKAELLKSANVQNDEAMSELGSTQATDQTADTTTDNYPVLSPGEQVNIGADTTEVDLGAKDIAGHFTATVENRGGSDQDDDPADNIKKVPIGADGTVALTSNDPHEYYTSAGSSTSITGHQAAHVSFEHEIDFSHGFSMSGALGIGSKTSDGADSVGFIFAPGDPSKATQGGSGGMLGLQGLDNAFGFVFDEYNNMSAYNDPGTSTGGWFPTNTFSPYVGWRTTGADGKLQKVSSAAEWKKTSELTLNRSQGNSLNDFSMDYSADTKTLTVKLGGQTFTRSISDVSSGYSISVSASTGGFWNDYSAEIKKFSYTPKTIPLGIKLVDSADKNSLLNDVKVSAVANIGDTVSVFSTQEAADRAVKEDHIDSKLVAVIPTDSAGNIYVIDGSKTIPGETGTVNHIDGDTTVGDGTYYSYTVKDGDGQGMTIPVRLAYKAVVTPVDSKTGDPIEGLEPTTVIAVKGQPSVIEIPGYTTTKITLDPPAEGEKDAQDKLVIDQGTTGTDTTTTNDQSNPIGHYYNGDSKTVDGHEVVTNATVGTGQPVADSLNKQPLNDKDGNPVVTGQKDDQGAGLKTITSDDYYWSNVGNATATDSTDEATPKASGSILVPTASTLDYWKGVASANQTKADTYKQQSQDMYDKFVGITGLNQKQKDDADSLLQSVVDIYAKVSQKNSDAKDAFEKAEAAADATSIYGGGQTGYATLEEVQNLLVSFKADLDGLTTKNDDVKSSLATFKSPSKHYTYGDEIKFPEISLGDGFGTVTEDKINGFENPDYYKYYKANDIDDDEPIQTPVNVGSYVLKLTDAGRTYLKSLAPTDSQAGLYVSAIVTIDPKTITAGINDATVTYGGNDNGQFPIFSGNVGSDVETDPNDFEVTDASDNNSKVSVSQLQAGKTYTISYTKDAQTNLNTDSNYNIQSFGTGTLTVNKRAITVQAQDHNKTYGDSTDPTLDLTSDSLDGLVNDDKISALNVKLTRQTGESAGTYDITEQSSSSSNYDVKVNKGTFTIAQKPITVTIGSSTITYGDSIPESKFTIDDGYSLANNDGISALGVTVTNPTAVKNVGTYHIIGNATNDDNYYVTVNNGTLTVNPKTVTVAAANNGKIYGDEDPDLTLQDPADVLVSGDKVRDLNVTLTRKEGENVGEYDINGTPTDPTKIGNYKVTVKPGKFNITQRAVTVTADNSSKVYGDEDHDLTLQDPTDVLVSGDKVSDLNVTLARKEGENVGEYDINGTPTDPTKIGNYKVTVKPGKFKITQKTVTVTASNNSKIYGNEDPDLTLQDPSGVLVSGDKVSDLNITLTRKEGENVGEYDINGIPTDPTKVGNYKVTVLPGKFNIAKRSVMVTIDSPTITYGDTIPTPTFKITTGSLASGDSDTNLSVALLSPEKAKNVGTYDITGGATNTGNYAVTINNGKLTIIEKSVTVTADDNKKTYGDPDPELKLKDPTDVLVSGDKVSDLNVILTRKEGENVGEYDIAGTMSADPTKVKNYKVTVLPGKFNIAKRSVTVTIDSPTITYGDTIPTPTFKITDGSLVGEDKDSALGVTLVDPADVKNVGTYDITGSATNTGNYAVTVNNGKLTITQKVVTVTADDNRKTYGGSDPVLTLKNPSDVLVSGDKVSDLKVKLTRDPGENVGEYTINGTTSTDPSESGNYKVTVLPGKFNIAKRSVTVTIDSSKINYGDTIPTPTFKITDGSLASGDSDDNLNVVPLSPENEKNVGDYEITGVSSSKNYSVTVMPGTLTIGTKSITVAADNLKKYYGDNDPALTYTVQGKLAGNETAADLGITLSREPGENVGAYEIAGTSSNKSYAVTVTPGTLTIDPKTITVTVDNQGKNYGDSDSALKFTIQSKLAENETATDLGITLTREKGEDVGTYVITGTSVNKNYKVDFNNGTFTITKRPVTVKAQDYKKAYNDEDPKFELTKDSSDVLVNEDSLDKLGVNLTRESGENVGSYEISGTFDSKNYEVTVDTGILAIGTKSITVAVNNQEKHYGSKDSELTFTVQSKLTGNETVSNLGIALTREMGEDVGTYKIIGSSSNKNYAVTLTPGTLKIDPKSITVAADDYNKTYGDSDPVLTFKVPEGTLVGKDTAESLGMTLIRKSGEDIGTYEITGSSSNKNYAVTVTPGTLTIDSRSITVAADDYNKTYGDPDPVLTFKVPEGTLVGKDVAKDLAVTLTRETGEGVGTYKISGVSANKNYTVDFNNGTFTIDKRPVTVKAQSYEKTYNNADPTFELTKNASDVLVNGDSLEKLGVHLTRAAGENVGSYKISGTSDSKNYEVTVDTGILAIGTKSITVAVNNQEKHYGSKDSELTFTVQSKLTGNETVANLGIALTRETGEDVGTYTISGNSANKNYTVDFNNGTFTITKRPVTVKSQSYEKTYNNADPKFELTKSASDVLVNGDTLDKLGVHLTRVAGENVGSYKISGISDSKNYDVTVDTGLLSITPAAATTPTEPTKPAELTYGDTPKITRIAKIGSKSITLKPDDFKIVNLRKETVDTNQLRVNVPYTIELTNDAINKLKADNPNYDFSKLSFGQLSIEPLNITVSINNQTMYAGGDEPQNSVKLDEGSELKDGDKLNITYEDPDSTNVGTYNINANMDKLKVDNPNYSITVVPGALKVLGKDVDSDGNVTITEKDSGGNVVKVTKQWNDGSDTIYTNNPADNTKGADEVDKDGKTSSTQTIDPHSAKTVLPNSDGSATVVTIDDSGQPVFTHYGVDPDHDGVKSADELKNGTDPLVYNSRGGSSSVIGDRTTVKKNQNIATTTRTVNLYNNEGNLLTNRALGIDTAWYSDEEYTIGGVMYYRVATDEFAKASDVYVYIDAQPMLIRVYNNVRGELVDYQGTKLSRELSPSSQWHADRIAVINGQHYYRVATNEFVPVEQAYPYSVVDAEVTTNFETPIYNERDEKLDIALLANGTYKADKVVTMNGVNYYRVATNQFIPVAAVRDYANVNFNITTNAITPVYNEHGQLLNIELPAKAAYKVDRVIYINGVHYYRVATNMFVIANRAFNI